MLLGPPLNTWTQMWIARKKNIKQGKALTRFIPALHSIYKQVIWFAVRIKWLVSMWNKTLGRYGLL